MTHKATQNWPGNYTYRGYRIVRRGTWDVFPNDRDRGCREAYGYTLTEAKAEVDRLIDGSTDYVAPYMR